MNYYTFGIIIILYFNQGLILILLFGTTQIYSGSTYTGVNATDLYTAYFVIAYFYLLVPNHTVNY